MHLEAPQRENILEISTSLDMIILSFCPTLQIFCFKCQEKKYTQAVWLSMLSKLFDRELFDQTSLRIITIGKLSHV